MSIVRNIQISAFVDHSTPGKDYTDDMRIVNGARKWLQLGIIPAVAITPDGPYLDFVKQLPPGTILAPKLGNRMTDLGDIDGALRAAIEIVGCGYRGELRGENESMLKKHWRSATVPSLSDITNTLRKFRLDGVWWTWQTGFFEPFQLGADVSQSRTFGRMKSVAKAVRDALGARFVTNRLAKPPTLKNATPGKPDVFNNDWYSVKAAETAAPFIDADHPEVCQVYSNKLYGRGGKTCRYWLQEEYGQALHFARISGADIAFDMGAGSWDDQTELDAWERAIETEYSK